MRWVSWARATPFSSRRAVRSASTTSRTQSSPAAERRPRTRRGCRSAGRRIRRTVGLATVGFGEECRLRKPTQVEPPGEEERERGADAEDEADTEPFDDDAEDQV